MSARDKNKLVKTIVCASTGCLQIEAEAASCYFNSHSHFGKIAFVILGVLGLPPWSFETFYVGGRLVF